MMQINLSKTFTTAGLLSMAALLAGSPLAAANTGNLILSANDESVIYRDNQMTFVETPGVGNLSVLDFTSFPPAVRTIDNVPVTVIGPPTCVTLVPGRPLAIVTSAMTTGQTDGVFKHEYDSRVALVDLRGEGRVVGLFETGLQPSGVTVTPDGGTAWLANRAESTVSVMIIGEDKLVEKSRVKIGREGDSLSHVDISPDGRHAVATLTEAGAVLILRVQPNGSPRVTARLNPGGKPYAARFLPDGKGFVVADIEKDSVTHFSFKDGRASRVKEFSVGRIPEGIDVSPDGSWIAVSCFDGGNLTDVSHPKYGEPSKIYFLKRGEAGYAPAGAVAVEGAPQFAVFSANGDYLAVSQTGRQNLAFLRLDGNRFIKTDHILPLKGEPVAAIGSR